MRLIDLDTGQEIFPNTNGNLTVQVTFPKGVTKGEFFPFGELVVPIVDNPKGFVRSKREGMSWIDYYPEVFNAKIVE